MKKRIQELAALRWQVLILTLAILVAVGYIVFAVFKFNKLAGYLINSYSPDEAVEEDEDENKAENEKPKQDETTTTGSEAGAAS